MDGNICCRSATLTQLQREWMLQPTYCEKLLVCAQLPEGRVLLCHESKQTAVFKDYTITADTCSPPERLLIQVNNRERSLDKTPLPLMPIMYLCAVSQAGDVA